MSGYSEHANVGQIYHYEPIIVDERRIRDHLYELGSVIRRHEAKVQMETRVLKASQLYQRLTISLR